MVSLDDLLRATDRYNRVNPAIGVKQITTGDYYEPKHPSSASSLIRTMLTVSSEKRANIGDICSHWWVNDGYGQTCLEEAEYLASLNPVRLDLLLSLAPSSKEEGDQVCT